MIPARDKVSQENKWNVEAMYSSEKAWEEEFSKIKNEGGFSSLENFKGKLKEGIQKVADLLNLYFTIDRKLEQLYTYAHLRYDEDLGNDKHKAAYAQIHHLCHEFQMKSSWIEPELLSLDNEAFDKLLEAEELKLYGVYLSKLRRGKEHTLSEKEERLLALSSKPLSTSYKAFSAFNNADMQFKKAVDKDGKEHEMSQGLYQSYLRSPDRALRKSAYETLHEAYLSHQNTLAELLSGTVENHIYTAKARGFKSSLDAALFPHNISTKVYENLIEVVKKHRGSLHKYISLRKKLLGVDSLYAYDLYAPLVEDSKAGSIDYKKAKELVIRSVEPLGESYQSVLQKGLTDERWVDVYENQRKRSGAYSSGCYDSHPYILMNYNGTLNDVFTLAHELGHSMHSYLSHKNQSFVDASYPIFVAEVASTFNEQLLLLSLTNQVKNKREKAHLLNHAIDSIRATFFRQTLFAEFELMVHKWAEEGVPLTPAFLSAEYKKLNELYYGPDLQVDENLSIEWARIPHFYYNYYVYQYATGIAAAIALCKEALKDPAKKESYLAFLSSGGSKYPVDLLRIAGVDMEEEKPLAEIINLFEGLVSELDALLSTSDELSCET